MNDYDATMAITIIQHDDRYRPGRLGMTLREHAFKLNICRIDQGDHLPIDFDEVDAVVTLGGPQQTSEGHAWLGRERDFLRAAHERDLPVVAIGLGAQILAEALGGTVNARPEPEAGFVHATIHPRAHTDTILGGLAWTSPQFVKHRADIIELPEGAQTLMSSPATPNLAYRIGIRTYAFLNHFEADRPMIDEILGGASAELHSSGITTGEFKDQATASYEMFARLADRLCLNIATYLIPRVANHIR